MPVKIIFVLILLLFLSGCAKQENFDMPIDTAEPVGDIVDEINDNSNLPAKLLEKVELTEREKGTIGMDKPYFDDRSDEGIDVLGFPYPQYNSGEVYITQMSVISDRYDVLGLTVGDQLEDIYDIMEKYGYLPIEYGVEGRLQYKKGDVSVIFNIEDEQIVELVAAVKVFVPEGIMF